MVDKVTDFLVSVHKQQSCVVFPSILRDPSPLALRTLSGYKTNVRLPRGGMGWRDNDLNKKGFRDVKDNRRWCRHAQFNELICILCCNLPERSVLLFYAIPGRYGRPMVCNYLSPLIKRNLLQQIITLKPSQLVYDDHCHVTNFQHLHDRMAGRCGICGDPWDQDPRAHEAGGVFANGIIVREYRPGQAIDIEVDVTANHFGYFTFKLCPNNNTAFDPEQDCFDR